MDADDIVEVLAWSGLLAFAATFVVGVALGALLF